MSTDWSTNKNRQFGANEFYLDMSNTFASIGLKLDSESIEDARNIFYNIFKRHNLCDNQNLSGNWTLFDRYQSSNNYTGNKIDNLIVLNSAIEANTLNQLYEKNNTEESINERKTLISNNLNLYKQHNLCNNIIISGFFPHLDVVDEIVSIKQISGEIPCIELGQETFYAEISYSDSCHTSDDPNKCIEPVPNLIIEKYLRNTLTDEDDEEANYEWIINNKNYEQEVIISETNNKIFNVSMRSWR